MDNYKDLQALIDKHKQKDKYSNQKKIKKF